MKIELVFIAACFILLNSIVNAKVYANDLEEVVISAVKVADKSKSEAVAQTTLSDIWIQDLYVASFEDLSFFVPGLYVQEQSINSAGYAIRGMTSNNSEATRSPRVSVWQHGLDISRSQGAYTAMYDIDRVDVFKGPVGSLFGHGGQIGGVNIINRFAQLDNSAAINLSTGNYNELKITGHYNQQLSDSNALRLAIFKHQQDGYIENSDGTDLNSVDTEAVRLGFTQQFIATEIHIQANYEKNKPNSPVFQSFQFTPKKPYEKATVSNGDNLQINRTIADIYTDIRYNLSDQTTASLAILYRDVKTDDTFDPDGTILDIVEANETANFSTFESQLKIEFSNNENFKSTIGFDYMYEEVDVTFSADINEQYVIRLPIIQRILNISGIDPSNPLCIDDDNTICHNLFDTNGNPNPYTLSPFFSSHRYEEQTESVENTFYSLFFDTTYSFTDKLSISTGIRFSQEELYTQIHTPVVDNSDGDTRPNTNIFLTPLSNTILLSRSKDKSSGLSGRLSFNYLFNDAVNLYTSYARGRRPDILNYTEQSQLEHLSEEIVDSYETGMHIYISETYSTVDMAVYYYDFKHFATQRSGVSALAFESDDNASASVQGVEIAYIQLFKYDLLLFTNLTYNDAVFDKSAIIQGENRFRYAPEWTGSISLSQEFSLNNNWLTRLTLQDRFQTEVFFEDDNQSNNGKNRQSGYSLINAYLDFIYGEQLTINLFVKNATDKEYIIDAGNFGDLFGLPTFVPGMGRHYGMGINIAF